MKAALLVRAPGLSASQGSKKVESQAAGRLDHFFECRPRAGAYTTLPIRGGTEETAKGKSTSEAESPPAPLWPNHQ